MKKNSSRQAKVTKKSTNSSLRLALESRLLFDGALVATANETVHDSHHQAHKDAAVDERSTSSPQIDIHSLGLSRDPSRDNSASNKASVRDYAHVIADVMASKNTDAKTLIVIDQRSIDHRSEEVLSLLAKPPVGSRLVVLDTEHDGLQQIAKELGGWHQVESLHIVPWVEGGQQWLGNTPLTSISASSVNHVLADWAGLSEDAQVVFHGPHVASESNLLAHVDVMTGAQASWMRDVAIADAVDTVSQSAAKTSVVFIDMSVEDPAAIVAATDPSAEIVYLYADQDGLTQIANYLNGRTGIDNIQLVSHGHDGELYLGDSVVSNANLSSYSTQLAQIGQSLSADGDILLYGCDVAQSPYGHQFVSNFASLTGADVAASDDTTGAAALGGDWDLEEQHGVIETAALSAPTWEYTLSPANTGTWALAAASANNTSAGVTTTVTFTPGAGTSFTSLANQTLNVNNYFSNGAQNGASLAFTYTWDTTKESAAADSIVQPRADADGGVGTVTITFSQPVVNPIIHIDRLGGNGGTQLTSTDIFGVTTVTAEGNWTNSSRWTLTTPGATLTQLAGVDHLDTYPTYFERTPDVAIPYTGTSAEAGTTQLTTAAGSIQVNGTYTTLTFQLTGVGVEGAGADGVELRFNVEAAPSAKADAFTMNEDATLTGNLLSNDGSGSRLRPNQ